MTKAAEVVNWLGVNTTLFGSAVQNMNWIPANGKADTVTVVPAVAVAWLRLAVPLPVAGNVLTVILYAMGVGDKAGPVVTGGVGDGVGARVGTGDGDGNGVGDGMGVGVGNGAGHGIGWAMGRGSGSGA
jgi:hypothetical protein